MDSVPYLTHLDFVKGVREFNELCDYVTIDLTHDVKSSGIAQYYKNPEALQKLLFSVNKSRMQELGKAACAEFEQNVESRSQQIDYSNSVARVYHRNCIVSTHRPMLIFVQVDLNSLPPEQQMSYLKILVSACKTNKIDGIVLE
jgi:hypothetical protein